jgi:sulfite reductase beta subunit-like hemoprotein
VTPLAWSQADEEVFRFQLKTELRNLFEFSQQRLYRKFPIPIAHSPALVADERVHDVGSQAVPAAQGLEAVAPGVVGGNSGEDIRLHTSARATASNSELGRGITVTGREEMRT